MSPTSTYIVESVRKLQAERDALLGLLRRIDAGVAALPSDLRAEIRSRLN